MDKTIPSWLFLALLTLVNATNPLPQCTCEREGYHGYKLLIVTPNTVEQNQFLIRLQNEPGLDFWLPPRASVTPVHIMVSPQKYRSIRPRLEDAGLTVDVSIDDMQRHIDLDFFRAPPSFNYDSFNSYSEIQNELVRLQAACHTYLPRPMSCVVRIIGESVEERPILVLEIHSNHAVRKNKSFYMDSLTHAREWLAGATVMKIADRLIRGYSIDDRAQRFFTRYDTIYILPVVNPDGYVYTMEAPTHRLWRKNRSYDNDTKCYGVDLNRNFDSNWGNENPETNPCDPCLYIGPSAASEPEVQAVQNFLIGKKLEVFLTFHAYGQFILIAYGDGRLPINWISSSFVADKVARAIEGVYNTVWEDGNTFQELPYSSSGTSRDWASEVLNVPYSYTMEVRPDYVYGNNGFQASPQDIDLSFTEVWEGIGALIRNIPLPFEENKAP